MADNGMEFKITTKAELAGAESVVKSLEKQIEAAKSLGKDFSELEKQLQKAQAAVKQMNASPGQSSFFGALHGQLKDLIPGLEKAEGFMAKMASGPLGLMAAGFAAVGAAASVAAVSIKEFMGVENAFARLDMALARSGQLTDEYRAKLAAMAGELQKTTGRDDDEWLGVLTRLTQFGADSSNIDAATDAVKNLAGILDGDLQSAAMMVSKALKGNFDMFGRYGLKVSETGTQTQKLDQLFKELAQRGGGQLSAQMTTLSGKITTLWNNVKDITKGIGGWIASTGIMQKSLDILSTAAEYWAKKLEKLPDKLAGLKNAAKSTTLSIDDQKRATEALNKEFEKLDKAYEKRQKAIDRQKSERERVVSAQKDYDLALVDEAEKKGRISKPQAILRRAGIEETYANISAADAQGDLERKRQNILFSAETKYQRISGLRSSGKMTEAKAEQAKFRTQFENDFEPQLMDIESQMRGNNRAFGYERKTRGLGTETALYDSINSGARKASGEMSALGGVYNQGFDALANVIVNMQGTTEAKIRELERRLGNLGSQAANRRGQ